MSNPHILSWVNPTTYSDGVTPYTQANNVDYEIQFDGGAPIKLGVAWATTFDMSTLPAYKALAKGNHTVDLAAIDTDGLSSAFTTGVMFPVVLPPNPPTSLSVA